jgi:SAM-dependent methyltransferase
MRRILSFMAFYAVAAVACIYLAVLGWMRAAHRGILHEITYALGWRRRPARAPEGPALEVPPVNAAEVIGPARPIQVLEPDAADGNVSGYELLVLASLVRKAQPRRCFEIGTFDGRTTLNLAANAPEDATIVTLDLPPKELGKTSFAVAPGDEQFIDKPASGARFQGTPHAARIRQVFGDSATFDYTPYEETMDLVFVDGAHSYEYVKSDTRAALRLLKPGGGMILWHDYSSPYWKGLTRALNELRNEIPELATMRHIRGTTLVVWERRRV